jgi:diguanylate cyclase (GGDEF)-like protein
MEVIGLQTEIVKLGPDLGGVMNCVTEQVQRMTGAGGAILELAEGEEMVYRASTGIASSLLGLRLARASSLSGLCVQTGQVLRCDDSETDPRVDRMACRKVGLRSMVVAPLSHKETTIGVLKLASPEPGFFTCEHIGILKLVSEVIAAAMFYSAKYETDELYHQATHDVLTGLANRALFYDRLRQSLSQASRQSRLMGVLNLDMDGLKFINDHFGHRAGDAAIREMASRIKRTSRASDTVARLGGDEFGVIFTEVRDRESASQSAERIAREICQPFRFEDHPIRLEASIGMALYAEDASGLEDLLEKADQRMYQMKRARKAGEPR